MSYIPVGTLLTYTATIGSTLVSGYTDWAKLAAKLSNDLRTNLPGLEEFDVTSSNGSDIVLAAYPQIQLSLQILNNGVDHADENDIKSIIDGTIQSYGNTIISSSIPTFTLPNNPGDDTNQGQTVTTGQNSNAPLPVAQTNSSGFSLSSLFGGGLSGGTIFGISTTIIIIAIVALVLLLPGNARKLVSG